MAGKYMWRILMLCCVLQIIFIGLKLTCSVDWSWWVVMIPTFVNSGMMMSLLWVA